MKRNTLLIAALALLSCTGMASGLTPDAALQRAMGELRTARKVRMFKADGLRPVLTYTVTAADEPAVYVFDDKEANACLVVSADDSTPALLGYSANGTYGDGVVAPALRYWLAEYGRQIEYVRGLRTPARKVLTTARPTRQPISPLTTTHWNQDAPFNDDCPEVSGERCVTGCVATALAQVMKYHNWPAKGTSSHSYTWNSQTLSVDYASTTYAWTDMADVYTESSTDAQKAAVANLMYSCGVAVDMNYTTSESGASSFSLPAALINYFDYDKGVRYIPRNCYGLYDWEQLVYDNLKEYGPVQYSGQSSDGGHSFVCDGYSSDGYFHINWGWGGMSDGYFLLTALDPETQGIGGSSSGYNYDQDIIYGVTPPRDGSAVYEQLYGQSEFELSTTQTTKGSAIYVAMNTFNFTPVAISGTLGLKFTPVNGGDPVYGAGSAFTNMTSGAGLAEYEAVVPESLADGNYVVTPCFRTSSGQWRDIPVGLAYTGSANASVSGETVNFSAGKAADLVISDVQAQTPFYVNSKYEITLKVNNSGASEFYGAIALALISDSGNICAMGASYPLDLMSGRSEDVTYTSGFTSWTGTKLTAGTYYICFVDPSTRAQLSDMQQITLNAQPDKIEVNVTKPVVADADNVDSSNMTVTSTVTCKTGYFGDELLLVIFPYSETSVSSVGTIPGGNVFVKEGESRPVTFSGAFNGAEAGKQYMCAVYSGQEQMTPVTVFTVKSTSGIDDVTEDVETEAQYYNLQGIRVPASGLAPGHYIKVTGTAGGKTTASHVIVR